MGTGKLNWNKATIDAGAWGDLSLVIDTDTYAGNFERALLAAATGVLTEYATGEAEEEASKYDGPDMSNVVGYMLNESGSNPFIDRCTIYPTPGWGNDGKGNEYRVTPDRPAKHPAYLSVRIPIGRPLSADHLDGVKRRALAFATREGFKIAGFRYVQDRTQARSVGA